MSEFVLELIENVLVAEELLVREFVQVRTATFSISVAKQNCDHECVPVSKDK